MECSALCLDNPAAAAGQPAAEQQKRGKSDEFRDLLMKRYREDAALPTLGPVTRACPTLCWLTGVLQLIV